MGFEVVFQDVGLDLSGGDGDGIVNDYDNGGASETYERTCCT
jgi:hypothetical protein